MRHGIRHLRHRVRGVLCARHLTVGAPAQVAEEIKRFGAMQPHPQSISQVLSCTDSVQLLEFLKEDGRWPEMIGDDWSIWRVMEWSISLNIGWISVHIRATSRSSSHCFSGWELVDVCRCYLKSTIIGSLFLSFFHFAGLIGDIPHVFGQPAVGGVSDSLCRTDWTHRVIAELVQDRGVEGGALQTLDAGHCWTSWKVEKKGAYDIYIYNYIDIDCCWKTHSSHVIRCL